MVDTRQVLRVEAGSDWSAVSSLLCRDSSCIHACMNCILNDVLLDASIIQRRVTATSFIPTSHLHPPMPLMPFFLLVPPGCTGHGSKGPSFMALWVRSDVGKQDCSSYSWVSSLGAPGKSHCQSCPEHRVHSRCVLNFIALMRRSAWHDGV
eukprot:1160282-Pelagomonas_calceolata.AAC.6